MYIAWVANDIKNMTLATGTVNLGHHHPAAVAAEAAMLDHMLEGRFMLGVSPGNLPSDSEVFGTLDIDRNEKFVEALEQIIALWTSDPPYDLKGKYWSISTAKTFFPDLGQGYIGKPFQKPYPPIFGTVVAPFSKGIIGLGERGWLPVSANFLQQQWVASHWPNYKQGCENAGRVANPADWRVARSIFVADDDKTARAYGRDDKNSPYRFYFEQMGAKMRRSNRLYVFKSHKEQPDEEITHDFIMENCVIHGSVNSVVDQILKLREQTGDFGELVYAGMDWVDPALSKRSITLLAEQVMPRVNEAIGKQAAAE